MIWLLFFFAVIIDVSEMLEVVVGLLVPFYLIGGLDDRQD